MSAHTPGPWRVTGMGSVVGANGSPVVLTSKHASFSLGAATPEREANTQLALTAPEVLAMLVEATARLNLCGTGPRDLAIVERANALIEKARGKS